MQYINIIFVCNEELKGGIQGYSLCLLRNQLKFQLYTCARNYHVRTIVGTLVRFEVGHGHPMEQEACFARATPVWLAFDHNTSVTSGE